MQEIIEKRKFMREIWREAERSARLDKCFLCGQANIAFCNSHLTPRFILQNISENGEIFNFHNFSFHDDVSFDTKCGLNNSGTFRFICCKCDSTYFSDYENENNIKKLNWGSKLCSQIIIKNFLSRMHKRCIDGLIPDILLRRGFDIQNIEFSHELLRLDIKGYNGEIRYQKGIIENNLKNKHYIFFQKRLNYKVPFAVQSDIVIHRNINGDVINDVYCMDENYKMRTMHLCIFPLKQETVIALFMDKFSRKRYDKFIRSFQMLNDNEQLHYISYLAFKYSEDIFFSPLISKEIIDNENLHKLSRETYDDKNFGGAYVDELHLPNNLVDFRQIPNLLLPQYHI